jgi:hypothetical protein
MGENERDEKRGDQTEENGLKVTDRRLFTSDGDLRQALDEEQTRKEEPAEETPPPSLEPRPPTPARVARRSIWSRLASRSTCSISSA